jgi:hypothetical protein
MSVEILGDLMPEGVVRMLAGRAVGGAFPFHECRVTGPLGVSQVSRLFRCQASGYATPLALKFCLTRDGHPDIELARMQYDVLTWLDARAQSGPEPIKLVRALNLIEEHACLVMEWVEGRSVAAVLASPVTSTSEIAFWSEMAGAWLKRFHDLRRIPPRPTDTKALIASIDEDLPQAPGISANLSFAHGNGVLRQAACVVGSIPVPCAIHHGDFKAENLMITGGALAGLDISSDWNDTVTLDLAKFIRDLDFRSWRPSGWMLGWRHDDIVRHFLAGYAQGEALDLHLPLLWARLHGLLRFWIELEATPPDPVRESYGRYRFEQIVTQVADELSRAAAG